MNLSQQRAIELSHQKETLLRELADWRERTKEGQLEAQQHMEKHYTQVRRIVSQMEGFLADITISDGEGASFDSNERAFSQILAAYRIWDYFRGKLALRDVSWLLDDLICADELAWKCYCPAREQAASAGTIDAMSLKEPPLVFFTSEDSPFAQARNTPYAPQGITKRDVDDFGRAIFNLPIPVIGVPWFQYSHLPSAVVIAHEVGHAVEHDLGLEPTVEQLIAGLDIPAGRKAAWLAWRHEIFADVYGALATGPASMLALMDYLMDDLQTIQTEKLTDPNWGRYPTRYLRMELNFELLRQLGLLSATPGEFNATRDALEKLGLADGDPVQVWRDTYEFHLMDQFEQDLAGVVKVLLNGPYPTFGNVSLREVISFNQNDLKEARDLAFDVNKGNTLAQGKPIRQLFAAATLAYHANPQSYGAHGGRQKLIQEMRGVIPKGVRSAGETLTATHDAADHEAGRNLLANMFRN